jgi:hypothetical protein
MNGLDVILESFSALDELAKKDILFLDDVPERFRPDLQTYIVGETLSIRNDKIVIGNNLYKKWLAKIRTRGFDYEIDFKK